MVYHNLFVSASEFVSAECTGECVRRKSALFVKMGNMGYF